MGGTSGTVYHATIDALTPLVGAPVAMLCVHGAAHSIGKPVGSLTIDDLPAVADRIRCDLRSFTSQETLEVAVAIIHAQVG